MKRLLLLLLLLLLVFAAPSFGQGTLEVIPLRHRTADQVIPILRPLRQREVIQTPGGRVVQESTVIQDASTGFEVVPRLSGGNVILEIAPQRENFAPGRSGAIQGERIASTVSARLGEWFELGGTGSSSSRSESGILSSRDRSAAGDRRIWVKVEEIR